MVSKNIKVQVDQASLEHELAGQNETRYDYSQRMNPQAPNQAVALDDLTKYLYTFE